MKKLLIALFIFVSISASAQFKLSTYKNFKGVWNTYTKKYDLDKQYEYNNIIFTFYETYIEADDKARSIYRIVKVLPEESVGKFEIVALECIDESNRECRFSVFRNIYSDESHVVIQYPKIAFFYMIKKLQKDEL